MVHIRKALAVHRQVRLRISKNILRLIVSYGSEAWVLTQSVASKLDIFERKILRMILELIKKKQ